MLRTLLRLFYKRKNRFSGVASRWISTDFCLPYPYHPVIAKFSHGDLIFIFSSFIDKHGHWDMRHCGYRLNKDLAIRAIYWAYIAIEDNVFGIDPKDEHLDITDYLSKFKCDACGTVKHHAQINVFQHPIVDRDTQIIIGYKNYRYCAYSLECQNRAASNEKL